MVFHPKSVQSPNGVQSLTTAGLSERNKADVKRLYLAGVDGQSIPGLLNLPKQSVAKQVKRLMVESTGLDVFAFKGVLSARLCGILDRHGGAVSLLARESVRVSGAIAAIDSELSDLGLPPDKAALLLQVKRDKHGVPVESCRIGHLCRSMLHRADLLPGAISLAESRADLVDQAGRLSSAMLKADQSLADSLGKVGVAAIRAAGENTGPTSSSANKKNGQLSPPVDFKDDQLVNAEILESKARYEEYLGSNAKKADTETNGQSDIKPEAGGDTDGRESGEGTEADTVGMGEGEPAQEG